MHSVRAPSRRNRVVTTKSSRRPSKPADRILTTARRTSHENSAQRTSRGRSSRRSPAVSTTLFHPSTQIPPRRFRSRLSRYPSFRGTSRSGSPAVSPKTPQSPNQSDAHPGTRKDRTGRDFPIRIQPPIGCINREKKRSRCFSDHVRPRLIGPPPAARPQVDPVVSPALGSGPI